MKSLFMLIAALSMTSCANVGLGKLYGVYLDKSTIDGHRMIPPGLVFQMVFEAGKNDLKVVPLSSRRKRATEIAQYYLIYTSRSGGIDSLQMYTGDDYQKGMVVVKDRGRQELFFSVDGVPLMKEKKIWSILINILSLIRSISVFISIRAIRLKSILIKGAKKIQAPLMSIRPEGKWINFILRSSIILLSFLLLNCVDKKDSVTCNPFCDGDEWYVYEFSVGAYPYTVPAEENQLVSFLENEMYLWKLEGNTI